MKIVTQGQMHSMELRCQERGITTDTLMENAGLAVARKAWEALGQQRGAQVLALIGPGNNGGDGLVACRHLYHWGARVTAYICAPRPKEDPKLMEAVERGIQAIEVESDRDLAQLRARLASARLVIDAVLGTGKARPLEGTIQRALTLLSAEKERRLGVIILALDLPTGLDADSGVADPSCTTADLTVTLGYPKIGLFNFPGASKVGRLEVVDIGIPKELGQDIPLEMISSSWLRKALPQRPVDSHKGTFGKVLIVAGSRRYIGAAYLACTGALRVGAGLVTLACPEGIQPILASRLTEVTYLPLPQSENGTVSPRSASLLLDAMSDYNTMLIGPGLDQDLGLESLMAQLILSQRAPQIPLVLDADGLNNLSKIPRWWERLKELTVITPHPGEMSRLMEIPVNQIQGARIATVQEASKKWGINVLLKGPYTLVASPQGQTMLNPFANPGLASAGTGDVLAGTIVGLMAQGLPPFEAAACGAYLHAAAGEAVRKELGEAGMLASDLLAVLPKMIKGIKEAP